MIKTSTKLKPREITYPYLGAIPDNHLIVLFTSPKTGMTINKGSSIFDVGFYSKEWLEFHFNQYENIVELRNEG